MAYTPINWQTGDTITADKLNNMESGISAGENGWEVTSSTTQLFSESVTTSERNGLSDANLVYSTAITADPLTVTMDGTDYSCSAYRDEDNMGPYNYYGGFGAGGPDFTNYPFFLVAGDDGTNVFVTTADGTYTVAAGTSSTTVTTTNNFDTAAQAAVGGAFYPLVIGTTTWAQVVDAMAAGKLVLRTWANAYDGSTTSDTQYAGAELVTDAYIDARGEYSVSAIVLQKGVQSITSYNASTADEALS